MNDSENSWSKNIIIKKEEESVIIKKEKEKEYQYSKEEKLFKALHKLKQEQKKDAFQGLARKKNFRRYTNKRYIKEHGIRCQKRNSNERIRN